MTAWRELPELQKATLRTSVRELAEAYDRMAVMVDGLNLRLSAYGVTTRGGFEQGLIDMFSTYRGLNVELNDVAIDTTLNLFLIPDEEDPE